MPLLTLSGNKEANSANGRVQGANTNCLLGGSAELSAAEQAIAETAGMEFLTGPAASSGPPNVSAVTVTEEVGTLTAGAYKWVITFVTVKGETLGSAEISATLAASKQAKLANIPLGPLGTIERKIYRTKVAGATGTEKLSGVIANNTVTTYVDNIADGSLTTSLPTEDTSSNAVAAATARRKFLWFLG